MSGYYDSGQYVPNQPSGQPGPYQQADPYPQLDPRNVSGSNFQFTYISVVSIGDSAFQGVGGTDAMFFVATYTFADAGSASDGATFQATETLSASDSGTGTDARASVATRALADSGSGADATTRVASRTFSEPASGADTRALVATRTLAESASGTDARSSVLTKILSEAGSAVDALVASVQRLFTDTASGADAKVFAATKTLADESGSGTDSFSTNAPTSTGNDGYVGWHQSGSGLRTSRRGLRRVRPPLRQPTRLVVLDFAEQGLTLDQMGWVGKFEEPLYVSDILNESPSLQEQVVDLLLAGVI